MKKGQGHGDHWNAITSDVETFLKDNLEGIISTGKPKDVESIFITKRKTPKEMCSIVNGTDEIQTLALLEKRKGSFVLGSLYPYCESGTTMELDVEEIHEWKNGYEATIMVSTPDEGILFGFFDTMYYKHKSKYKVGERYTFNLSALAYDCAIPEQQSITLDEETSNKLKSDFNDNDDQGLDIDDDKPMELSLDSLTCIFPLYFSFDSEYEFLDEYQIQSPICKVRTSQFMGMDLYKMDVFISRDEKPKSITIPVYAKQSFFDRKPRKNEPMQGVIWIFGQLVE